jgi:response regulator of citrate/malate metabolism
MAAKKTIETVCDFLKASNRPYSVSDLVQNLENVGKAAVVKALDYLVEVIILCSSFGLLVDGRYSYPSIL